MLRPLHKVKADRGAALVLIAVSMMLLIGMAALAVDLGALRSDIRADTLAADAAVTAGVAEIDPFSASDAQEGCEVAWDYLLLNIQDEGTTVSAPNCALLAGNCMPGAPVTVPASAGPYSFVITYPVLDGDPLMGTQAINPLFDGVQCQRLGVSIERNRDHWFARVLGFNSNTTNVSAVARHAAGPGGGEIVPLLVLEPISCNVLTTDGQGRVTVSWFMDTPGFIVVDSDGSKTDNPNRCGNNIYTIDNGSVSNGWIRAIPTPAPGSVPSVILSYALSGAAGSNPIRAYHADDLTRALVPGVEVTDPFELLLPETWFRLYPTPSFTSQRITRAALDHRYNCKLNYPDYPLDLDNPGLGGIPISPCLEAPATHIDDLVMLYGAPVGVPPMGVFQKWTDFYPCTVDDLTWGPAAIAVAGDWWVDCPGSGLIIGNSKIVTFSAGNVVVDGNVHLKTSATLQVNPFPVGDHVIFIRDGDLIKFSQSSIQLIQTMAFLQNGAINIGAGAGGLTWTAPLMGNFEDLALWAEARDLYQLGGQATNTLTGTFFTPFADPFELTGQSGQFQTDAQFITRRLVVKGLGEVKMHPDPDRSTPIPIREVRLIR